MSADMFYSLEGVSAQKPLRLYKVIEPMVIGKAHLLAGTTISYDPVRNEFTLRGALEFDPWEEPDGGVQD